MSDGREATLRRLGIVPGVGERVRAALDDALERAEAARRDEGATPPAVVALDAGCGRSSALARYRARIGRFVGVDIHARAPGALPYLDEYAAVDLGARPDAFPPETFDVVLSSFTVEHLAEPGNAFANLARWLRPGGSLILTTVNRRHPFVAAYLAMPASVRRRIQPVVKASSADVHPLVGACNDPAALRAALAAAGYRDVRVEALGNLARAWGRRLPTFALGLAGDLLTRRLPSRRSTLVVTAHVAGRAA